MITKVHPGVILLIGLGLNLEPVSMVQRNRPDTLRLLARI